MAHPKLAFWAVIVAIGGFFLGEGSPKTRSAIQLPQVIATQSDSVKDELQQSLKIDTYKEVAEAGPSRGENIYYHKCWMCHNKYQKEAPRLAAILGSANSASDSPLTEPELTDQILNGGPGMPSFRTALNSSDVADVR